jgi:hypothetical protein
MFITTPLLTELEGSLPCQISGSHGDEYEDDCLLGCRYRSCAGARSNTQQPPVARLSQ